MADGTGGAPPPDRARHYGRDGQGGQSASPGGPADAALDWITIWQSELAAMATDRELQEGWVRMVDLWAQAAQRTAQCLPRPGGPGGADGQGGRSGAAAPARAEATMAAPDARDAAVQRLADRVEELERQLRALSGGEPGGPP
jgi:hypothetical protein